jgi:hypothetical protein
MDPFAGDPGDPSAGLDPEEPTDPLSEDEKQDVLDDLEDLELYQTLLEPSGIRGLVVDCEDCHEPHYFNWELLRANLRHLLADGRPRVHEPAFNPDPEHYVTWDYARGYADGVQDTLAAEDTP